MTETTTVQDAVQAAAERILAAGQENGSTESETIEVTKAVLMVKRGSPASSPLVDNDQYKRRWLAHQISKELYNPELDAEQVYAAVARRRPPGQTQSDI
ncbi:hypothetical protein [Amycolatopsis sp. NPDC059657]|uniref:hypothetical protein n=1 Tax=Amycolatopsis sp. NPDC059657 TaxID=3346899 RepID=UPI0036700F2F